MPGDVHVWWAKLPIATAAHVRLLRILSEPERERARRFARQKDCDLFVLAHGALRSILANYLASPPEELQFQAGGNGKPRLATPGWLHFNLSHSGSCVVIAVASQREIGVDVEQIRHLPDLFAIAARSFAPAEFEALAAAAPQHLPEAFFRLWVRKEAYVKALGMGLGQELSSFQVSFEDEAPRLLAARGDQRAVERWSIQDVSIPGSYKGALVVEAPARPARLYRWGESEGLGASA
jgi:4'-phosphopantetheinyl transferase